MHFSVLLGGFHLSLQPHFRRRAVDCRKTCPKAGCSQGNWHALQDDARYFIFDLQDLQNSMKELAGTFISKAKNGKRCRKCGRARMRVCKMIKRRNMLKMLAGGAMLAKAADVKRVLVMFKCHLDVGFTDTQAGVMKKYFEVYYPEAMKRAAAANREEDNRYTWTTGSWLLYEYLEQASADAKKKMEQAMAAGDIAWHALPFSWQTEVLDRTMIAGALGFSKSLDARFGRTTAGAKMTDVPGHTLGLIGPLEENGVRFLHIGVNSASTPPDVPALFVWKDGTGATLIVMYQHKGCGSVVQIPGSDLAVAIEMADDNAGPHSMEEIRKIYADLRKEFPGASIKASNLSDIANAVYPYQRPVARSNRRNRRYVDSRSTERSDKGDAVSRSGATAEGVDRGRDAQDWGCKADLAFLRKFALFGEHTWGTDTKTYLDHDHYKPADLEDALEKSGYQKMITSWAEKRKNIDDAVLGLPAPMRAQAVGRLARLKPVVPTTDRLSVFRASKDLETTHFVVALDEKTGAIRRLQSKSNSREWATAGRPLALFSYQTFSADDYARFMDSYVTSKADWAPQDFGKPNIEHFGARSRSWTPRAANCWSGENADGHRLLARLPDRRRCRREKRRRRVAGEDVSRTAVSERRAGDENRVLLFRKESKPAAGGDVADVSAGGRNESDARKERL